MSKKAFISCIFWLQICRFWPIEWEFFKIIKASSKKWWCSRAPEQSKGRGCTFLKRALRHPKRAHSYTKYFRFLRVAEGLWPSSILSRYANQSNVFIISISWDCSKSLCLMSKWSSWISKMASLKIWDDFRELSV